MGSVSVLPWPAHLLNTLVGSDGTFSLQPEKIRIDSPDAGDRTARGTIRDVEYLGPMTRYVVDAGGASLVVLEQNDEDKYSDSAGRKGREVTLSWRSSAVQAVL